MVIMSIYIVFLIRFSYCKKILTCFNLQIYRQTIVDRAQERCYYLTFFPARHILAFYDYFTSEKLDEKNEEECKTLIRFVNSKAQLPSRKDI